MLNLTLLAPEKSYLLGLSGGRDSVCLLHLLLAHGFRNLHLIHLNHQLRGEESEGDADFVRHLAEQHQLPHTLETAPVAELAAKNGTSLETAAREARHQLFAKISHKTQCPRVLLAHHADDQAETCLFNLLRGSAGVKGMEPETFLEVEGQQLIVLRPLLQTRRSEITSYLQANKLAHREDSSNRDPAHTRNRLRHEALPLLQEILDRDIVPALLRANEATREREKILTAILETLQLRDPQGRLFLPKLRQLSPSLQRACLKQYLDEHEVPQISSALLDQAVLLIAPSGPPALNLPGNRFLRRKEGRIFLT